MLQKPNTIKLQDTAKHTSSWSKARNVLIFQRTKKDRPKDPGPNFKGSPSMLMLASIYAAAVPHFGSPFPNCLVLYLFSMYRTRSKHCWRATSMLWRNSFQFTPLEWSYWWNKLKPDKLHKLSFPQTLLTTHSVRRGTECRHSECTAKIWDQTSAVLFTTQWPGFHQWEEYKST